MSSKHSLVLFVFMFLATKCLANIPYLSDRWPYVFTKLKDKYCVTEDSRVDVDVLYLDSALCTQLRYPRNCCREFGKTVQDIGTLEYRALADDQTTFHKTYTASGRKYPKLMFGNMKNGGCWVL